MHHGIARHGTERNACTIHGIADASNDTKRRSWMGLLEVIVIDGAKYSYLSDLIAFVTKTRDRYN